jgi:predicted ATP-grasp superfamily ATP-dependent carboligase
MPNVRSERRPIAIVTDGMYRKSLAAIRSLGKAGFDVHVFGDGWLTVGFWSHFTKHRIVAPDAKDNPERFGLALVGHLEAIRARRPDLPRPILLPMEDETFQYVIENAETLRALADFILPDRDSFAICMDKGATMALAARLGTPHPSTEIAKSASDLMGCLERRAQAEYVVKPLRGSGSRGVRYNPKLQSMEAQAYIHQFGPALVQDRISPAGDAIGVSFLFDGQGRPVAHFCHKRLRQFPNNGGPSTDRIGIENPDLVRMSAEMLGALNWKGVAMVEWKTDPGGLNPKLLEINPRFWGSLELAIRSGVDFPVLYARAAAGKDPGPSQPMLGVRCRWLIPGDILRWLTAKPNAREGLIEFLSGLNLAEEWDRSDLGGMAACIVCQGLSFLRPKYFKLLVR